MMHLLGGQVERGHGTAEFGRAWVDAHRETGCRCSTAGSSEGREQVWMSHGDHVSKIAPGFQVFGTSPNAPFAITADPARHFYAVQFHPEVHHTPQRRAALRRISSGSPASPATGRWAPTATRRSARSATQVGDQKVICGLSGGVDSARSRRC